MIARMSSSLLGPRARVLIILGTAAFSAAFLQCVGDDPTTTPTTNDAGSDASVGTDAASTTDGGADAGSSVCAWDAKFDAPVPVAIDGLAFDASVDGGAVEGHPSLSPDELTIYFHGNSGVLNDGGTGNDIFMATRGSKSDPFGAPVRLPISTNYTDTSPSVSNDGTALYYDVSAADGGLLSAIWVAQRGSTADVFGSQHLLASPPASPQAGIVFSDGQPFISADSIELWFTSRRDAGTGALNIYSAQQSGGVFGAATEQDVLNSNVSDYDPSLSADRLTVYFSSGRPGGGGGADDIWRSHRFAVSDDFPAPMPVVELNSPNDEFGGWLSPDNCRFYFETQRDGIHLAHLYMAERSP